MENLGRLLILVAWDKGFLVPAFPGEIELHLEDKELLSKEIRNYTSA